MFLLSIHACQYCSILMFASQSRTLSTNVAATGKKWLLLTLFQALLAILPFQSGNPDHDLDLNRRQHMGMATEMKC